MYILNFNHKLYKMKKIILVCISIVFTSNTFSQYAVVDFFVIKGGMESQYLLAEKVWKNYHQASVENGEKIEWTLWKRAPKKNDDEMVPHYATLNRFATKEDMDNYVNKTNILELVRKSNKGKISNKKMMISTLKKFFNKKSGSKKIEKKLNKIGQNILGNTYKEINPIIEKNEI